MTFEKGVSGNKKGRPVGIADKRTKLRELLEPHAEELVAKAIELAKAGDTNALRLCIERLIPKAKNETINLNLSDLNTAKMDSLLVIGSAILESIIAGELTPEQGKVLSGIVNDQRDNIITDSLATKIAELEKRFCESKPGYVGKLT